MSNSAHTTTTDLQTFELDWTDLKPEVRREIVAAASAIMAEHGGFLGPATAMTTACADVLPENYQVSSYSLHLATDALV